MVGRPIEGGEKTLSSSAESFKPAQNTPELHRPSAQRETPPRMKAETKQWAFIDQIFEQRASAPLSVGNEPLRGGDVLHHFLDTPSCSGNTQFTPEAQTHFC